MVVGVGGVGRKCFVHRLQVDQGVVVVAETSVVVPVVELFQVVPELVEVDPGRGCHFSGQDWLHLAPVAPGRKVLNQTALTDNKIFLVCLTHFDCFLFF